MPRPGHGRFCHGGLIGIRPVNVINDPLPRHRYGELLPLGGCGNVSCRIGEETAEISALDRNHCCAVTSAMNVPTSTVTFVDDAIINRVPKSNVSTKVRSALNPLVVIVTKVIGPTANNMHPVLNT